MVVFVQSCSTVVGCWDLPAELKDLGKFSAFTEKFSCLERSVGRRWFDFSVNSFIVVFQHAWPGSVYWPPNPSPEQTATELWCWTRGSLSWAWKIQQQSLCACVDHTKIPVVLPCISESHFLCSVKKVLPAWRGLFITSDRRRFRKILWICIPSKEQLPASRCGRDAAGQLPQGQAIICVLKNVFRVCCCAVASDVCLGHRYCAISRDKCNLRQKVEQEHPNFGTLEFLSSLSLLLVCFMGFYLDWWHLGILKLELHFSILDTANADYSFKKIHYHPASNLFGFYKMSCVLYVP